MDAQLPFLSPDEIKKYQEKQLVKQLQYVMGHSPFYRRHLADYPVDSVRTLEDLLILPTTSKNELQRRNMDFLSVDRDRIIDYITTSGTTGSPVTFAMTENDLERLSENELASFICAGGSASDVYQLMLTLDRRFMAGLAYFMGLRKLGAGIIRVGPGNAVLQFDTIRRTSPTVIVALPSFLLTLIDYADEHGIDLSETSIKSAVCIGEPIRDSQFRLNELGKRILDRWDIRLHSTYASTEMGAAFTECMEGCGGHHNPEMLVVEFLGDDDRPVGDGELGEVCITTLGVEAMPLVRFKTGDLCYHFREKCACGRHTLRVGPIVGRKNQMIKFKGTTLYPPAFYEILHEVEGVENYVVVVSTNNIDTDDIVVVIGSRAGSKEMEKNIKDHFRAKLRVAPQIQFRDPQVVRKMQLPEGVRKPITFIDRRKTAD